MFFKCQSSFEFLQLVMCCVCSDVSDEHTALVFRVTELVSVDAKVTELPTNQEAEVGRILSDMSSGLLMCH
jgi:hypothetical protein